jgi:hypothetical protein
MLKNKNVLKKNHLLSHRVFLFYVRWMNVYSKTKVPHKQDLFYANEVLKMTVFYSKIL